MNREDIHSCGYYCTRPACIRAQRDELRNQMERRIAEAVAAEREACAKTCEAHGSILSTCVWVAEECAALIRKRGEP